MWGYGEYGKKKWHWFKRGPANVWEGVLEVEGGCLLWNGCNMKEELYMESRHFI